ncbi:hypothetical protein H9P43_001742 [Blastocladiella emersonii ATCC 22665]|nr:hypothetical protein H9P43_001742 [Blastocladiella emersonii ATCC 22665]
MHASFPLLVVFLALVASMTQPESMAVASSVDSSPELAARDLDLSSAAAPLELAHLVRRRQRGGAAGGGAAKKNANGGRKQVGGGNNNAGANKGGDAAGSAPIRGLSNNAQFCNQVGLGRAVADGTQKKTVTCSRTVQGAIPSFENMVSTIILAPQNGARMPRNKAINFAIRTRGLDAGFFENPNERYYVSPQTLNSRGQVEGHQHVTVQRLGNAQTPPDARSDSLAFFKGLDQEDTNGILTTTIPADAVSQPGLYRLCTMTGTRGHQPVIMPVARRGAQDDCIRINIV